jgi:hypothetical protein
MIRHLPIIKIDNDKKAKIAEKVDFINKQLSVNGERSNEDVLKKLREIDSIIFSLFSLTNSEKSLIISKVKEHIKFFSMLY